MTWGRKTKKLCLTWLLKHEGILEVRMLGVRKKKYNHHLSLSRVNLGLCKLLNLSLNIHEYAKKGFCTFFNSRSSLKISIIYKHYKHYGCIVVSTVTPYAFFFFLCSCVGSFWVLQLPPSVLRHASQGNWWLQISTRCECKYLYISLVIN